MILPKLQQLFELFVESLLYSQDQVLHHHDLVSLGVVRVELERIIQQRPFFLVEDFLALFQLRGCQLFLLLLLALLLLLLFLLVAVLCDDKRVDNSSVDDVLVAVELVAQIRLVLPELLLLSPPEIKDNLQHPPLVSSNSPELVVKDDKVILESVDGLQVNVHTIPGNLFELLGEDLALEYLNPAFFSDFGTLSK